MVPLPQDLEDARKELIAFLKTLRHREDLLAQCAACLAKERGEPPTGGLKDWALNSPAAAFAQFARTHPRAQFTEDDFHDICEIIIAVDPSSAALGGYSLIRREDFHIHQDDPLISGMASFGFAVAPLQRFEQTFWVKVRAYCFLKLFLLRAFG
jgi:hypothetical protein